MSTQRNETVLLARYAEGLFWMARYVERVENLARLIDVTQTFESRGREDEAWSALLRINADEGRFREAHGAINGEGIKRFYLLDRANPTSIPASAEAARTNARTLRPLISTEMWLQLNVFHRDVLAIAPEQLQGDHLNRLCARLKEGVQAHTGITEGTFFRDQGWNFYMLGRLIERADQTTRLLDIKYHLLHLAHGEERRVAELVQWGGVLRAAAGYHAFRRVAPAGFEPADVVAFLLSNRSFPRSVTLCVSQVEWHLMQLRSRYNLRGTVAALERIEEVRAALSSTAVDDLVSHGLHEFLDALQRDLILLAGEIGYAFFRDWRPEPQAPSRGQTQSQSQSQSAGQGQPQGQSQGQSQTTVPVSGVSASVRAG